MVRNYTNLESDFMWQDILKAIEYLTESAIDVKVEDFKTAVEKGYPSVITPLTAVTEVNDGLKFLTMPWVRASFLNYYKKGIIKPKVSQE